MNDRLPLSQRFAEAMGQILGPDFPSDIALAVSGGGDSMAMLHLAADWAHAWGVGLRIATVDHGLRSASALEARLVADEARTRGIPHATLRWQGWDGQGNLQAAARRARLDLIGQWRGRAAHVLFAHTRDDQAETLLLRLRRGSGVEGLSGMAPLHRVPDPSGDWHIVRPLLDVSRAELRHHLRVLRIPHIDDPSNADTRYDRVRIRKLLAALGEEGLDAARLSETVKRMRRARTALGRRALDAARAALIRPDDPGAAGSVILDRDAFSQIETDTQLRILAAALQFVASARYRPREVALEAAMNRALAGGVATLHGCVLIPSGARLIVAREFGAVAMTRSEIAKSAIWDRRWHLDAPEFAGFSLAPLGETGLAQARNRRATDMPRAALLAHPAVWHDATLIACRAIGHGPPHHLSLDPPGGDFPDRLLSH